MLKFRSGTSQELPVIYEDMQKQFPEEELLSFEDLQAFYNNGLMLFFVGEKEEQIVSYMFVHDIIPNIWLDYFAVLPKFQGNGYGTQMLELFKERFKSKKGCYLEVALIDENNPDTIRRASFYERFGAVKLPFRYFYPASTPGVYVEMDLYYISFWQTEVDIEETSQAIRFAYSMSKNRDHNAKFAQMMQDMYMGFAQNPPQIEQN